MQRTLQLVAPTAIPPQSILPTATTAKGSRRQNDLEKVL